MAIRWSMGCPIDCAGVDKGVKRRNLIWRAVMEREVQSLETRRIDVEQLKFALGRCQPATPPGKKVVIENFRDAIRNGRPPMITGRKASGSRPLIETMENSSPTGRRVDIPC